MSKKNFCIRIFVILVCIVSVAILQTSCVNEDNQLGLSFVKSNGGMDILHSPDNIASMYSVVFKTDSLETSKQNNFVLGSYKDSFFGKVKTSIYTSLALQDNEGVDFTAFGTIDSVVLCLAFSSPGAIAKDTSVQSDMMNINVYLLNEAIDSTKKYSNSTVAYDNTPVFSSSVMINPLEPVVLGSDTIAPHIRMKLSESFRQKIASGSFETQAMFAEEFKGLYISASSSSDGFLAYINMISDNTGIFVYYHDDKNRSYKYMINFSANSNRFMHIDKDYTSSELSVFASLGGNDTLKNQQYIYLASLGIAEAKLDLLNIEKWYNQDSIKGAALNRAELILPVADVSSNQAFMYPSYIQVRQKKDSLFYLINDEVSVDNWTGNRYDASLNAYRLDVTSFLQNYLLGNYDECTLYLLPDVRISSASRVVLNGFESSNPPRLNIIYSHPASN